MSCHLLLFLFGLQVGRSLVQLLLRLAALLGQLLTLLACTVDLHLAPGHLPLCFRNCLQQERWFSILSCFVSACGRYLFYTMRHQHQHLSPSSCSVLFQSALAPHAVAHVAYNTNPLPHLSCVSSACQCTVACGVYNVSMPLRLVLACRADEHPRLLAMRLLSYLC